jgi:uncharacterized membrane protein HdeD (DUF308 family)
MTLRAFNVMLLGAIAMACLVAGAFFLRFWQQTHDRFFAFFAASFFVEAANRAALAVSPTPNDGLPVIYFIRLISFLLILLAIIDKNRAAARQSQLEAAARRSATR